MALRHHIGLTFAVLAGSASTFPVQAENTDGISGFFERGAAAVIERSKKVCLPGLSQNAGQVLSFPLLRQQPEQEATELLARNAIANAALLSVCVSDAVAASGADAYLFLGSTVDQPRTIILNGKLSPLQQEETLFAALIDTRELFSRYNQNLIEAGVLTQPRALKLVRESDNVVGETLEPLALDHIGVAMNLFNGGETYFPPKISLEPKTEPVREGSSDSRSEPPSQSQPETPMSSALPAAPKPAL